MYDLNIFLKFQDVFSEDQGIASSQVWPTDLLFAEDYVGPKSPYVGKRHSKMFVETILCLF